MRRLSRVEYANTVRDLFGDTSAATLLPTEQANRNLYYPSSPVSGTEVERYNDSAAQLAQGAVAHLSSLLPCDVVQAGEAACIQMFVQQFGRRLFRRPVSQDETDRFLKLYSLARQDLSYDVSGGVRVVLQTMLQSPRFLYRWELGDVPATKNNDGTVTLTGYELASRLSYFLWQSTPDLPLLDAAAKGDLATAAGLAAQTRRLLADPKSAPALQTFFTLLLELEAVPTMVKNNKVFPAWSEALRQSVLDELTAFSSYVVHGDGDGSLETLLGASYSFANGSLNKVYGLPASTTSSLQKTALDPKQRAGLLTQPAFLAAQAEPDRTNPIRRGRVIYEHLINCGPLPPPPPGVAPTLPTPSPNLAVREQLQIHRSDPSCAGCHTFMDPIGLAFENYDGIGKFRTVDDNGKPVDASGTIPFPSGSRAFTDGVGLAAALTSSAEVPECFARQMYRFAMGRTEQPGDQSPLDSIVATFSTSHHQVPALLTAIATSPAFAKRSPSEGEVTK